MNTGLVKNTVTLLAIFSLFVQSVYAGASFCSCQDDSQQVNSCCHASAAHTMEDNSKSSSCCQDSSVSCCSSGQCCCSENQSDFNSVASCQCDGGGSNEQPLTTTTNSDLTAEKLELNSLGAVHYLDTRPVGCSSCCFANHNHAEYDSPSLQALLCIWQT